MSMRSLQPQVKAIQQRYAGDQVENFVFSIINMLTTIGSVNLVTSTSMLLAVKVNNFASDLGLKLTVLALNHF